MKWRGIDGGTPLHGKSLCEVCRNSHIIVGDAASEKVTFCLAHFDKPVVVPFKRVVECSDFADKTTPRLSDMEKIAFVLATDKRGKPIGFVTSQKFRQDNDLKEHSELVPSPDFVKE